MESDGASKRRFERHVGFVLLDRRLIVTQTTRRRRHTVTPSTEYLVHEHSGTPGRAARSPRGAAPPTDAVASPADGAEA